MDNGMIVRGSKGRLQFPKGSIGKVVWDANQSQFVLQDGDKMLILDGSDEVAYLIGGPSRPDDDRVWNTLDACKNACLASIDGSLTVAGFPGVNPLAEIIKSL